MSVENLAALQTRKGLLLAHPTGPTSPATPTSAHHAHTLLGAAHRFCHHHPGRVGGDGGEAGAGGGGRGYRGGGGSRGGRGLPSPCRRRR